MESSKNWLVLTLLCFFLGGLGIHRFYVGKNWTGVLWLVTFGLLGIGTVVDFIMIVCEKFTDAEGKIISR
ncbi:MAG: TM2 domain-containing protein [Succinivibrionaceae bacterium]